MRSDLRQVFGDIEGICSPVVHYGAAITLNTGPPVTGELAIASGTVDVVGLVAGRDAEVGHDAAGIDLGNGALVTHGEIRLPPRVWAKVLDDADTAGGGALIHGLDYYLSEKTPGNLSRTFGRWCVPIGTAIAKDTLTIRIDRLERNFTPNDVVESVWIRSDFRALAFAFADGTDAVFVSNTLIMHVNSAAFIGPLLGGATHRVRNSRCVARSAFYPPMPGVYRRDVVVVQQTAKCVRNGAEQDQHEGTLAVSMLGAEQLDGTPDGGHPLARGSSLEVFEPATGLVSQPRLTMATALGAGSETWIAVPATGELHTQDLVARFSLR